MKNRAIIICLLFLGLAGTAIAADEERKFHLRWDLYLGGGYDTNIFRESNPLTDDFDYPSYQPDEKRKNELYDVNSYFNLGYYFPKTLLWEKSKLSIGVKGAYNRTGEKSKDNNLVMENYYQWGVDGDLYIKFSGKRNDEGFFMVVNDAYSRTKYTNANSYLDDNSPATTRDSYDYSENMFKLGFGYMLPGSPPLAFEYKLPSRTSTEKKANENYDYEAGRTAYKIITGLMIGHMSMGDGSTVDQKYDPYKSSISVQGSLLRVAGEYWSRRYKNYTARNLDGTVDSNNPLLVETRRNLNVDLYIGSIFIVPVFTAKLKKGINLHYEYYKNEDNHEQYYDYIWNRGWAELVYGVSIINFSARYEYHQKEFQKRLISLGTEKRKDTFRVAKGNIDLAFSKEMTMSVQYAYTKAESNERAAYLNYDKHKVYAKFDYFLDRQF